MKILTAKTRITIGLACLVFSVLCTAMMIGLMPDPRAGILDGRAKTCESIAIASSDFISRGELERLRFFLETQVERNDEILTAGVRRENGKLVAEVGDHTKLWKGDIGARSTATHVHVPIRSGEERWGTIELHFTEVGKPGLAGWLQSPWVILTAFVTAACYLLFFFYLAKMLRHLDPGKTVPKRVREALDSLAEGLLVIDRNDRIVLANQAFAAWVNRAPEKLIGVPASKLPWCRDETGGEIETYPWAEALRQERAQAAIMLGLKTENQATRVLMANASPVLGHNGKYQGVLVSFDDVTQLEETKRNLSVAKQEAEDANQAKSEFLARMSHEIRTPMNAILGYTDVLRRGFDESVENRQEYLDTIHASGEHLLALINDILDLSKVESGRMELETERCSPHKLLSQVVTLLRSRAEEKGISLEFKSHGLLPETILTDSVRLRQTIVNLVGNAIKFTETGGVTIVARLVTHAACVQSGKQFPDGLQGGTQAACATLQIEVIDTGIGISPEAQDKIFDPFAQADTSVTRKFGGTGLGLAISKQLAEAMGGGIEISSEAGKGSTFTVTVDVGSLDGIEMVDGQAALQASVEESAEGQAVVQLPPARVLVADDGPSNRKLVELVLGRAGAEVVSVENGQQAVDAALSKPFDVILMDMQMPVMDGYTATTTLRSAGCQLPIIALTAYAMRGDEEKCRAAGCSGFLTKPIDIDTLVATLADVLDSRGSRSASAPELPSDSERDETDELRDAVKELADCVDEAFSGGFEVDDREGETREGEAREGEAPAELQSTGHSARREPRPPDSTSTSSGRLAEPVLCSLPLEDPDFLEIAHDFVGRLKNKLAAMKQAWNQRDLTELASLAHWLKGSGGTAGFDAFTDPAMQLESLAKSAQTEQIATALDDLIALSDRIQLPSMETSPQQTLGESVGDHACP